MDDFDLFKADDDALGAAVLTQKSLIDTQERLGAMLDVMPIGLLIHTQQGILFANRAACDLLRTPQAQLVGQHLLDYVRASDLPAVSDSFSTSFAGSGESFELETVMELGRRSSRLVRLISSPLPWPGNPVIQILVQDITDQKRAEHSLRQLTITDELTGAYNRRHASYEAALYMDGDRAGLALSVVMVDIDHFKAVNDTRGHAAGDAALKQLVKLANEMLPTIEGTDSAIFARLGGEEFVMLLPGLDADGALMAAERLRNAVEQMVVHPPEGGGMKFTISAGVATCCGADRSFDDLLNRADQALYEAKGAGRNRVMVAPQPSAAAA